MQVSKHDSGVFNWVDLQTTDLERARAFYTAMFGWTIEDSPIPGGGVYATASLGGRSVCGMSTLPPELGEVPPHWNTYVSVDDVDSATGKVEALGGRVLAPPFDVMEAGRMSVVAGPDGAPISLWQPGGHIGAGIVNEPNTFCWNELYTKDLDLASAFCTGLFGWTCEDHDGMGMRMRLISHAGRQIGTMVGIESEWGPVPSHWAVYFAVADCDGWLDRSKELGATVFIPPKDIPEVGRFAGVADPQGAHLMVIQLAQHSAGA